MRLHKSSLDSGIKSAIGKVTNTSISIPILSQFSDWIETLATIRQKSERKKIIGNLLTTWWHVWLERNRRIFQQRSQSAIQVAFLIKDNIDLL